MYGSRGRGAFLESKLIDTYFFVLVSRHRNELGLFKHVRPERRIRQLQDIVGPHQVKPGLVFVHRIQDRLELKENHVR